MNEFELIARLIPTLPGNDSVVLGAGDDCAVLRSLGAEKSYLLFKTDAVVEGVHFTRETDPGKIGHKALGRCLSDVAAMAGTPLHAVVTLGLPREFDGLFVERIYAGLNALASRYRIAVVGGETVTNPDRVFISVAVLGKVSPDKCVFRSGAKSGDALFVTGRLGGSLAGGHLDFEPRLAEAQWLVEQVAVHAMIDLSDGLAGDLRHLLQASHVGAELLGAAIPISRAARLRAKAGANAKPPLLAALTDGEDFELLFTVPSKDAVRLLDRWKQRFPQTPLSCIGKITAAPGLILRTKDGIRPVPEHGYVHFA
jgi:thiamine-monophosphate kinase